MIIAFPTKPSKHGGPGSFQQRFEYQLSLRGHQVVYPEDRTRPDVVMVLGGTRKIAWLLSLKAKGVPVIFRLGGISWLFKFKLPSGMRRIKTTLRLRLIPIYQRFLASGIIYQSEFSKEWLLKLNQSAHSKNSIIIYNGIDLDEFKPVKDNTGKISLLCVEGNIDYTPYAIDLLNYLQENLIEKSDFHSLILYGGFEKNANKSLLHPKIDYRGVVSKEELPSIYRNAVYLSLDVNAACPNTVIEALACGAPVVAFDTGSLNELVPPDAGILVPYGSDPWKLAYPDVDALAEAILRIKDNYAWYSANARKIAEERFSIEDMAEKYLEVINELIKD